MALKEDSSGLLQVTISKPEMIIEGAVMRNLESDETNPRKYFFFTGIPYARPMLGENGFQVKF